MTPAFLEAEVLSRLAATLAIDPENVDRKYSFSELRGDSIHALRLSAACKNSGVELGIGAILKARDINDIVKAAAPLAASPVRVSSAPIFRNPFSPPKKKSSTAPCLVTATQEALLLKLPNGSSNVVQYSESWPMSQLPALKQAWQSVITSEPTFSIRFARADDRLHSGACMLEGISTTFTWRQVVAESSSDFEILCEKARTIVSAEVCPYNFFVISRSDLARPLATIVWSVHHALIDGFSFRLILQKVRSLLNGRPVLPPSISFIHYAHALHAHQELNASRAVDFWKQSNDRYPISPTELAVPPCSNSSNTSIQSNKRSRKVQRSFQYSRLIPPSKTWRVPVSTIYLCAYAQTLSFFSDVDDVSFGVVLSGRTLPLTSIQDVIGPSISTLPLALHLQQFTTAQKLSQHIQSRLYDLNNFVWSLPRHGYNPQFLTALNVQVPWNALEDGDIDRVVPDTAVPPSYDYDSPIPLSLTIEPLGSICIKYHESRYSNDLISHFADAFVHNLGLIAEGYVHDLPVQPKNPLPPSLDSTIRSLSQCYAPRTQVSAELGTLISLFARAVSHEPRAIAVERGEESISYAELDRLSDLVAGQIQPFVLSGKEIGVHADGSIFWVVAIYAVIKAGGVYCPLNQTMPTHQRNENFTTAEATLFLCSTAKEKQHSPPSAQMTLSVEELISLPYSKFDTPEIRPTDLAYTCFTSGSSGKPKGVRCKHGSLVAFQRDFDVRLRAHPGWRIAQTMSASFDGSIHEIFSALSYGATLVLADTVNPFSHIARSDAAILTPSVARNLPVEATGKLSVLYLVGEMVTPDVRDKWASSKTLFNMYGPTEATCGATIVQLRQQDDITVGMPNPSSRVYVLDHNHNLLPPGVVGEVYLAGVQISAGYINLPEVNAERFINDSVCPVFQENMYRTGDRGYWSNDNGLVLLGRNDRQVKLRGFRIDLDDIEARIVNVIKQVEGAAVIVQNDVLKLVVRPAGLDAQDVIKQLLLKMPSYMTPRVAKSIEQFPMTPIGKLDYKAIGDLFLTATAESITRAPPAVEACVAQAWQETLNLTNEHFSPNSNFIQLGGSSISALQLQARLTKLFNNQIPLKLILGSSTLKEMTEVICAHVEKANRDITAVKSIETRSLSSISGPEKYCYKGHASSPASEAWTVSFLCSIGSSINKAKLVDAWSSVLSRHDVLRSQFEELTYHPQPVRRLSGRTLKAQRVCQFNASDELQKPFDLAKDYLVRVLISDTQMLVTASHIVCDYTAVRQLLTEVKHVYSGEADLLQQDSQSYLRHSFPSGVASSDDIDFWTTYMQGYQPNICHAMTTFRDATSLLFKSTPDFQSSLRSFASQHNLTIHHIILAATALVSNSSTQTSGVVDTVLGAPHVNRDLSTDQRTAVGLYLQPLPIRIQWPPSGPTDCLAAPAPHTADFIRGYLQHVKSSAQSALSHAIPWSSLIDSLNEAGILEPAPSDPAGAGLIDTMVTFHDRDLWDSEALLPDMKPCMTWPRGYKFKMLAEWTALSSEDAMMLRLEFNPAFFKDAAEVKKLGTKMMFVVQELIKGSDCAGLHEGLIKIENGMEMEGLQIGGEEEWFGMLL